MNKKVSINFCGGCNPKINRGEIASKVRGMLETDGYQVDFNAPDVDFVIYLSGCTASCALKYSQRCTPHVAVAAATLDAAEIKEEMLVTQIVTKVRNYLERLEKDLSK